MKLNRIKRRNGNSLILEITPLIDVVFLLLIFFMVATTFQDVDTGIKIDLPTSTVKSLTPVDDIQVIVTKNKDYFVKYKKSGKEIREKTTAQDLKNVLIDRLKDAQDKNIIISADKNVTHGIIVDVMTASKEAGATSLDIDTAPPGK
ncbi:biopolymer transporter ExbD [uncultured Cetobacterium sp.]|uniref:ExbD/TolR family protein n=1 Tax=uncultured Cetobacterium sp. TaxID=527638 RepID=UPI0026185ADA|nr:biopolymer transporter ExbD [uncultured Cetobacterium sp.]